jgi:hypothetical protein
MHLLSGGSAAVVAENTRSLKNKGMSERDATLTSMKNAKSKRKKGAEVAPSSHEEEYPYNTRMDLDHDQLEKLGIAELPKVGQGVHIHAKAKVHSVSEESRASEDGGKSRRRMGLQITHMRVK